MLELLLVVVLELLVELELCSSEYIANHSKELADMPNDQKKTRKIHKILHEAQRVATKPCVCYPCRDQILGSMVSHNLCAEHLYKLIDAIKKYEEENDDRQVLAT